MNRSELMWSYFKKRTIVNADDKALRNTIAVANIGLLHLVSDRFRYRCNLSVDEIEQIGSIGLLRAVERFDPTSGNAFSSYAVPMIVSELWHYLRDHGSNVKIPRRWREENARAKKIEQAWLTTRKRIPTETELAAEMGTSIDRLREIRAAISNQIADPLDEEFDMLAADQTSREDEEEDLLAVAWIRINEQIKRLSVDESKTLETVYARRLPRKIAAEQLGVSGDRLKNKMQLILDFVSETKATAKPQRVTVLAAV